MTAVKKPSKTKKKKSTKQAIILAKEVKEPLWLSVSEIAKLGGIAQKTIRRALDNDLIKFKIINDRYLIDLRSALKFINNNTKLQNKFIQSGLGQYIDKWK